MKAELENVEHLTEEEIDGIVKWFLKDFKDNKLKADGWPITVSAYKISKAVIAAYTRFQAKIYPPLHLRKAPELRQW